MKKSILFSVLFFAFVGIIIIITNITPYQRWNIETKQACAFNRLVREICNNPQAWDYIDIHGSKSGKEYQKESFDAEKLKNWASYDFICISEGNTDGGLSVTYRKRSDGSMEFFSKIFYIVSYDRSGKISSWVSIPYYEIKGISDNNLEKKELANLQAIEVMRKIVL